MLRCHGSVARVPGAGAGPRHGAADADDYDGTDGTTGVAWMSPRDSARDFPLLGVAVAAVRSHRVTAAPVARHHPRHRPGRCSAPNHC